MNLRTLRRRCEQLLREIQVPDPFDVRAFADEIGRRRGRSVSLVAKSSPLGPCGMWLALPDVDVVFFEVGTTQLHREHIIVHELAHMIAAHEPTEPVDPTVLTTLLPSLDPAVVRQVLARTRYSAVEEQEAELLASLVLARAGQNDHAAADDVTLVPDAEVLGRLQTTLGGTGSATRG